MHRLELKLIENPVSRRWLSQWRKRTMADVKIILPDGSAKEYAAGTTLGEAVKQLSNSLAKKVLAAEVNGELTDLREELVDGSTVSFLTF